MKTGGWGRADWVMLWLAAGILCLLAGHAPAQESVLADREVLVVLSNTQLTGSIPSASFNNPGMPSAIFVPVLLTASGQNNSFFTSELTLTNRDGEEATLHYTYTAHRGGGSGTATDSLPPGQQRIVPDAIGYLSNLGIPIPGSGNRLGTLRVEVSGSSDVGVSVRTTTMVADGRAGLAFSGIATSAGFEEAVYLCGLRQNNQDRSNVAFQHMGTPENGPITLRATVFSGDREILEGHVLEERILVPGGFHQYNGILNLAGFDNGYVKVERVSGTAPFYAYGVINDQANSDGSFVFPLTAGSLMGTTGQTLPVIVETGKFTSELTVTNFSDEARTIRFSFVADQLTTPDRTARFSLRIGAGRQRIIPDVIDTQLRQRGVVGIPSSRGGLAGALFARVASGDMSGIVIGARTSASDGRGGQYGVFYHALPDGAAFTGSAWVDGLQQDGENRSNLALVNTGEIDDSPSVFTLDIYDGTTGMLTNTVTALTVPPRGWRQINGILGKYAPGATQGYVRIRKIVGNNPFLAYGVINDGGAPGERSGDGAYLPATERTHDPGKKGMTEREVLEVLYHATGGPDWNNPTNWLSEAPLSEWHGITTDGNGRVTRLYLAGNGLSGTIPRELGELTHLQELSFHINDLSGTIPPELGQLARLKLLELEFNQLSGRIPRELSGLTNLQRLGLAVNQLSGVIPPELAGLTQLQALNLGFNRLSGAIPPELGKLARLEWLALAVNQLSGAIPSEFGNLTQLQSLELNGNELSGGIPPELSRLTHLEGLSLRGNQLSGAIPNTLQQLSELTKLDIRETQICIPTDPAFQAWLGTLIKFFSSEIVCDGTRRVLFSASNYEVKEGETVMVSVRLIDQTGNPVRSAEIALTASPGGGATAADYSGVPERVTIIAPANEASIVFTAVKDDHFDHSETVVLGFHSPLPTGVTVGSPETATVTIQDPGGVGVTNREVLEAVYHATGGPNWRNRTHWLSDTPLSAWYGVETDESGRVTSVSLSDNRLTGTIPPVLGQLARLDTLNLGGNQLSGTIPLELGGLSNLQELDLGNNQLRGGIPPELGRLTQLQSLRLWRNELTGTIPPELAGLSNLRQLYLGFNQLSGMIPPELGELTQLQALNLRGNQLSGGIPPELGGLTKLQELSLGSNQLSGRILPELGGLTQLQELILEDNQLSGEIPPELGGLTRLHTLFLGSNQLSGGIPPKLGGLTQLTQLLLDRNQLSGTIPPELGQLDRLKGLDLDDNQLNGSIPPELGGLSNLRQLYLGFNQLSGMIPPELGKFRRLEALSLGPNQLSGAIPPELGGLIQLTSLRLWRNELSGAIPPELGGLTRLRLLNLHGNRLSGAIPPEMTQLTSLRALELAFNENLTGTIPPGLHQLSLYSLDLMATSVCVPEDREFQEWLTTIEQFTSSGLTCGRRPDPISSIDILVVYTPAARKMVGGTAEMEAKIDLMIAETNQAYLDSGVNQRVVLVAREEIAYVESGFPNKDIPRLHFTSDGYMDEVHAVRDGAGADLVHLIWGYDRLGLADLMGVVSASCAECGSRTFAHELGHNMGLHHDRYVTRVSVAFPDSHGFVNQQAFAEGAPKSAGWFTIMAYGRQCAEMGLYCDSIMRFSDPNQTYLGDPLGVPGEERTLAVNGPADAVRTLNITRHSVAGWRPRASGDRLTMPATVSQARPSSRTGWAVASSPTGSLFRVIAPIGRRATLRRVGGELDRATLRRREVSIDIGILARVPDGGSTALTLNLFDDAVLTGIIDQRTPTYSGGYALSGRLAGVAEGSVTLVVNGSVVAGTVRLPGATFRIRPAGAGRHAIIQVDPSQFLQQCEVVRRTPGRERSEDLSGSVFDGPIDSGSERGIQ